MKKGVEKKIIIAIIVICILSILIFLMVQKNHNREIQISYNNEIQKEEKIIVVRGEEQKENKHDEKIIVEYDVAQVELNSNNCEYIVNETEEIEIEEYIGNEDIIMVPAEINGQKIDKIDKNAFENCENLERIQIARELVDERIEIKYFEINKETENEEYVEYVTTKEYNESYLAYMELTEEEKAQLGVIPSKFYEPVEEAYSERFQSLYSNKATIPAKYDLRDYINIKVENQKSYGICYAFATLSAIETNLSLRNGKDLNLSEIHLAIMTEQYSGGSFLTSENTYYGIGPVLEERYSMKDIYMEKENVDMYSTESKQIINKLIYDLYSENESDKKENEIKKIEKEMLEAEQVVYVDETVKISSILNSMKTSENEEDKKNVENIRKQIKTHIMNYGGLYTVINADLKKGEYTTLNYQGNGATNHAVTIIGWDDNFSKDNFSEENRPNNDGAYLVLNSWGESSGEKGCFWASYEDKHIESALRGVISIYEEIEDEEFDYVIDSEDCAKIINYKGNDKIVNVPDKINGYVVTEVGNNSFLNNKDIEEIILPSTITQIGYSTFFGCTSLMKITMPEDIVSIGDSAFWGCTSLNKITIPKGITRIGEHIFNGCTSLTSVGSLENVTSIGISAFKDCSSLTNVGSLNSLQNLGSSAFFGCIELEEINSIGDLKEIPSNTFSNCKKLKNIIGLENTTNIGRAAFSNCASLEKICLSSLKNIEDSAFIGCTNLETVESLGEVTILKNNLFSGCKNLTNIVYLEKIVEIKNDAFGSCAKLNKIEIGPNIEIIEEYAFFNSKNITIYGHSDTEAQWYARTNRIPFVDLNVKSIKVKTLPNKIQYNVGDNLNIEGLVLKGIYTDGTTEIDINNTTDFSYSPKKLEQGNDKYQIVVTYGELTTTFEVQVAKRTIDMSGVQFKNKEVTYNGESQSIEIEGELPEGVTVSYVGNGAINAGQYTVTAKFEVDTNVYNVIADKTAKLTILKAEPKVTPKYDTETPIYVGGELPAISLSAGDTEGTIAWDEYTLEVGTKEYSWTYTPEDAVNYKGTTGKVSFTVLAVELEEIEIKEKPEKLSYYVGDELDTEGLVITATYNNGDTEEITEGFECNPKTLNVVGEQEITVTYEGKTATFKVQVAKRTINMTGVEFKDKEVIYNGQAQIIEIEGELPEGVTVSYVGNGAINAGQYTVTAKFEVDTNIYNEIADKTAKLIIAKAEPEYTVPQGLRAVYGKELSEIELPEGYSWEAEGTTKVGNVGKNKFTVKYIPEDTENYKEVIGIEVEIEVSKAEPTVNPIYNKEQKVYVGGNLPEISLSEGDTEGTIAWDEYTLEVGTKEYSWTFIPKDTLNYNTKTGKVEFTVIEKYTKEDILNDNSKYEIEEDDHILYITNIIPETTIEKYKEELADGYEIELYDKVGNKVTNEKENIETNMKMKVYKNQQKICEYILVVIGDLNGDAIMNDIDLLMLARYKVKLYKGLSGAHLKASDIYNNKIYADDLDLLRMARILVGLDSF